MKGESLRALGNRLWHDRLYIIVAGLFLGIGTAFATLGFTIFYTFWLQPLPYPDAHRLVVFRQILPAFGLTGYSSSAQLENLLQQRPNSGVQKLALLGHSRSAIATLNGEKQLLYYRRVSPDFFSLLVHHPYLGRWPSPAAAQQGGPSQAVLSYSLWKKAFAGKASAIGSEIQIDGHFYQVVGILGKDAPMDPLARAKVYLPLVQPLPKLANESIDQILLGQLKAGVSPQDLQPWLDSIAQEQIRKVPPRFREERLRGYRISAAPVREALVHEEGISKISPIILYLGLFLWGVALMNVVNYALLRHRSQLRGYAIRQLLGATQTGLGLRLLAGEIPMLTLALTVSISLLLLGYHSLVSLGNMGTVFALHLQFWDWAFLLLLLLLSAMGIVALPLWHLRPRSLKLALTGDERIASLSRSTRRLFQGLGVLQLTLAIALLSTALDLSAAGYSLAHRSLGFQPKDVEYSHVYLPAHTSLLHTWEQTKAALASDPYVRGSAFSAGIPWFASPDFTTATSHARSGKVIFTIASAGFFPLLGIPLEQGKSMSEWGQTGQTSAWLDRAACSGFFPRQDCLGNPLKMYGKKWHVAGVMPSISWSLAPDKWALGTVYLPLQADTFFSTAVAGTFVLLKMPVASESAKKMTLATLRRALPGALFEDLHSYPQLIQKRRHLFEKLTMGLAIFAFLVTGISVFGAYTLQATIQNARLPEYRIRRILGAQARDFYRRVFRELAIMGLPGFLLSVALAALLIRAFGNLLHGGMQFLLPAIATATVLIFLALGTAVARSLHVLLKLL